MVLFVAASRQRVLRLSAHGSNWPITPSSRISCWAGAQVQQNTSIYPWQLLNREPEYLSRNTGWTAGVIYPVGRRGRYFSLLQTGLHNGHRQGSGAGHSLPRSRMVELYFHSPIRLHGVVSKYFITRKTSPSSFIVAKHSPEIYTEINIKKGKNEKV
jgi:hypothetical protein